MSFHHNKDVFLSEFFLTVQHKCLHCLYIFTLCVGLPRPLYVKRKKQTRFERNIYRLKVSFP